MDGDERDPERGGSRRTWLLLAGVFLAAAAVTVAIGSRVGSSTETTYPDLGDIAAADPNLPGTDQPAPTFAVPTLDGSTFDLAQHLATDGRPVVLNLWASWCYPCRSEMPAIDTAATAHPDIAFVGVSVQDTEEDATAFAQEIGVGYTIGFDDGTVEEAYPVLGLPATFFIGGDGTLLKTEFGGVTVDSLDDDIATLFGP